jgi:5-methylthioadenosine/S-adenosylhomocysteine deaminase
MDKIDRLIHARWIITCEDNFQVLENHALAIKGGLIHAILPSSEATEKYPAIPQSHYNSHAIMPGFINGHTHISMNVFRGLSDDLALMDWLNNHIWPAEGKWLIEEMVYDGSLLAMGEMIRGGTTCFNDMYFFMQSTAKAAELAGMRAHLGMHLIGFPNAYAQTIDENVEKGLAFYHEYKNHEKIRPTLAPHSTYTLSLDDLKRTKLLADELNVKINIHAQESPAEIKKSIDEHGKRPLQRLNEIGLVSSDLIAVHMTQIDKGDFAILQEHKPSIVHCPESNMKLASGACPVQKLIGLGINIALGTDGAASNNDLDMIGEMRTAAFLGKITTNDPCAVSAETVLKMATINGAKALGIDHITGSITAGKSADFIAIDLDQLETQPLYSPVSQIVYAASRNQVTDVWVAGKQLLKHRQLMTLDEKELLNKAKSWRKKIGN